jgi:kynureninase
MLFDEIFRDPIKHDTLSSLSVHYFLKSHRVKMKVKLLNIQTREDCLIADKEDKLKYFREKFTIPNEIIYMMGNSLGLCPKKVHDVVSRVILDEWGTQAIEGWSKADWYKLPQKVGNKLGKLIGAEDDETLIAESTSVSIFKCLATSIGIQKIDNPHRRVIVLEKENFPTDNYIAEGLLNLLATDGYEIRYFDWENPIEKVVDDDAVVVLLSLVNYRTGKKYFFY